MTDINQHTEKGNEDKRVLASESEIFSIMKLADFVDQDPEMMLDYLQTVRENLPDLQKDYMNAIKSRHYQSMSDLKHKKVLSMDILELHDLKEIFVKSLHLLNQNDPSQEALNTLESQMNKYLQRLDQDISTYLVALNQNKETFLGEA